MNVMECIPQYFEGVRNVSAITWATVAIAAFAILAFFQQLTKNFNDRRIAQANYKLALFEKRVEVYYKIEEFLLDFQRNGHSSVQLALEVRFTLRTAHFLFPSEPLVFIKELSDQAIEYQYVSGRFEKLKNIPAKKLTDIQKREMESSFEGRSEIESWFHDQIKNKRLEKDFALYLHLPESV